MNQTKVFEAMIRLQKFLNDEDYMDIVAINCIFDTQEDIEDDIRVLIDFANEQQEKIIELEGFCASLSEQIEEFDYEEESE